MSNNQTQSIDDTRASTRRNVIQAMAARRVVQSAVLTAPPITNFKPVNTTNMLPAKIEFASGDDDFANDEAVVAIVDPTSKPLDSELLIAKVRTQEEVSRVETAQSELAAMTERVASQTKQIEIQTKQIENLTKLNRALSDELELKRMTSKSTEDASDGKIAVQPNELIDLAERIKELQDCVSDLKVRLTEQVDRAQSAEEANIKLQEELSKLKSASSFQRDAVIDAQVSRLTNEKELEKRANDALHAENQSLKLTISKLEAKVRESLTDDEVARAAKEIQTLRLKNDQLKTDLEFWSKFAAKAPEVNDNTPLVQLFHGFFNSEAKGNGVTSMPKELRIHISRTYAILGQPEHFGSPTKQVATCFNYTLEDYQKAVSLAQEENKTNITINGDELQMIEGYPGSRIAAPTFENALDHFNSNYPINLSIGECWLMMKNIQSRSFFTQIVRMFNFRAFGDDDDHFRHDD